MAAVGGSAVTGRVEDIRNGSDMLRRYNHSMKVTQQETGLTLYSAVEPLSLTVLHLTLTTVE